MKIFFISISKTKISKLGKPLLNGIFVEIGALNGVTHSNTKFLEDHFGWHGILIEGTPHMCNRLQNSDRNRSIKICSAICNEKYVNYTIHKWNTVNGIVNENKNDSYNYQLTKIIKVKCERFDDIFKRNNMKKIDFFSLDVEGAEYITLKTFDWSIPVHYWIVEINRNKKSSKSAELVHNLMNDHGYKLCENQSELHNMNTCFYLPNYPNIS